MRRVGNWRDYLQKPATGPTTVAQLAQATLEAFRRRGKRSTRDLESVIRRHILPDFGPELVSDFKRDWAQAWVDAKVASGLSPKTVGKLLWVLRAVLDHAVRDGRLEYNPARGVEAPPAVRRDARDELETLSIRLMTALCFWPEIPLRRRVLWALLLLCGLRIGEASGLIWSDYDPRRRALHISRAWCSKDRAYSSTKTGHARLVPVSRYLARILDRCVDRGPDGNTPIALFRSRTGRVLHDGSRSFEGPWRENTALRWWGRDLRALGATPGANAPSRLHSTRSTFVNQVEQAGAKRGVVLSITHSGPIGRTAYDRHYRRVSWAEKLEAIDLLRLDDEAIETWSQPRLL